MSRRKWRGKRSTRENVRRWGERKRGKGFGSVLDVRFSGWSLLKLSARGCYGLSILSGLERHNRKTVAAPPAWSHEANGDSIYLITRTGPKPVQPDGEEM